MFFKEVQDSVPPDHTAIDLYSFPEVQQMGRSIEAGLVSSFLQNGGQHMSGRTFTVGPPNVDRFETLFRMVQVFHQGPSIFQIGLVSYLPLLLIIWELLKQPIQKLLVFDDLCFS